MDNVLYQENMLCLIILGHICRWKILKLSDLCFYRLEEHVDDVVYQENMFCSIILGHICS